MVPFVSACKCSFTIQWLRDEGTSGVTHPAVRRGNGRERDVTETVYVCVCVHVCRIDRRYVCYIDRRIDRRVSQVHI